MILTITSGALDETVEGDIILRGMIAPASLPHIQTPAYQREQVRESTIEKLHAVLRAGDRFPDVDLAVRGQQYGCTEDGKGTFTVTGNVYMTDGFQRITAGRRFLLDGGVPKIGCMVHFGTNEKWERERFEHLNDTTKVSPNVKLRNRAFSHPALHHLRMLCSDPTFSLGLRVCWGQYMMREELMTATTFLKIVSRLHHNYGPSRNNTLASISNGIAKMVATVGEATISANTRAFFDLVQEAWGMRDLKKTDKATHLRVGFLSALADVLADYPAIWVGRTLRISRELPKKLSSFRFADPSIETMARANGGAAVELLNGVLTKHINRGKRTRRAMSGGTRVAM